MTLLTVSVGRRPYVHETTGHILLSANGDPMAFDPTADHKCSVTARLNDTGITLDNASWVADLSSEAVLVRNKKKRRALFCPFALGSLSRACLDKSLFSEAGVTNGRRFLIAAVSFRFVSFRFAELSILPRGAPSNRTGHSQDHDRLPRPWLHSQSVQGLPPQQGKKQAITFFFSVSQSVLFLKPGWVKDVRFS